MYLEFCGALKLVLIILKTKSDLKRHSSTYLPVQNKVTNTRKRCQICLKLIIKTPEQRQNMFKVNNILTKLAMLVSFLLTLRII